MHGVSGGEGFQSDEKHGLKRMRSKPKPPNPKRNANREWLDAAKL